MYEYVSGILDEVGDDHAVVDVCGLGYLVAVSKSTLASLPPVGEKVKLFTHHYVREDAERLFGFATRDERGVFLNLLDISQVGPKVALGVLSGMSLRDLTLAVQTGDTSRFKAVSGVGPKTAQRIVLELKGKLDPMLLSQLPPQTVKKAKLEKVVFTAREDAYAALQALGYSEMQVVTALARVEETLDADAGAEVWIRSALKVV